MFDFTYAKVLLCICIKFTAKIYRLHEEFVPSKFKLIVVNETSVSGFKILKINKL